MTYETCRRVIIKTYPLFVIVSAFFFVFQNPDIVQASPDPVQLRKIAEDLIKQGKKFEAAERLEEAGEEGIRTHKPFFKFGIIEIDPLSLQPIADLSDASELFYEVKERSAPAYSCSWGNHTRTSASARKAPGIWQRVRRFICLSERRINMRPCSATWLLQSMLRTRAMRT